MPIRTIKDLRLDATDTDDESVAESKRGPETPPRKRGRPRKTAPTTPEPVWVRGERLREHTSPPEETPPAKKRRGRPPRVSPSPPPPPPGFPLGGKKKGLWGVCARTLRPISRLVGDAVSIDLTHEVRIN